MPAPPFVFIPAFLVPLVTWLSDRFTSRAWKVSAAFFFVSAAIAAAAALVALVVSLSVFVPAPVSQAMSVVGPSDWPLQLGALVSIRVITWGFDVWRRAYFLAVS